MTVPSLRRKILSGSAALFGRQAFAKTVTVAGYAWLSNCLSPAAFGLFAMAQFVVTMCVQVMDPGLTSSLIRQETAPSERELKTGFTFQVFAAVVLGAAVYFAAEIIAGWYKASGDFPAMLRIVAVVPLLAAIKSIPATLLERELEFPKIALGEALETLAFYATAVPLAVSGFGAVSFAWAIVARHASSMIYFCAARPWRMSFGWSRSGFKSMAGFGVPYQASAWVSMVRDGANPIAIGRLAGEEAVGLVSWAINYTNFPVLLTQPLGRVFYPAFARIQHDRARLVRGLRLSVETLNLILFPLLALFIILSPRIIPRFFGEAWLNALPIIVVLGGLHIITGLSQVVTHGLNATGASRQLLGFNLLWAALAWIFVPLAAWKMGVHGYAVGMLCVFVFGAIPFYAWGSRRLGLDWRFGFRRTFAPAAGFCALIAAGIFIRSDPALLAWSAAATAVYGFFAYRIYRTADRIVEAQ